MPPPLSAAWCRPATRLITPLLHHNAHAPHAARSYIPWDDYFMAVAFLSAQRSKDPNKQVC